MTSSTGLLPMADGLLDNALVILSEAKNLALIFSF